MHIQQKRSSGLTLIDVLVIIGLFIIFLFLVTIFWPYGHSHEEARRANCRSNVAQIGKAIDMYTQYNGGYYPFAWGPPRSADSECRADLSIALLYPEYVESALNFRCPSTENEPVFTVSNDGPVLKDTSYGYDCRVYPSAVTAHAILGDMDGSYSVNKDTVTQNHTRGQNVLYVDGHVSWETINFASNDALDNIFAEDPWSADTDSYLVWPGKALDISYDGYPELQQTIETTDEH